MSSGVRRLKEGDDKIVATLIGADRWTLEDAGPYGNAIHTHLLADYGFIAEADGAAVGCILALPLQIHGRGVLFIRTLVVAEAWRRSGVATQLIRELLLKVKQETGIDRILFTVFDENRLMLEFVATSAAKGTGRTWAIPAMDGQDAWTEREFELSRSAVPAFLERIERSRGSGAL